MGYTFVTYLKNLQTQKHVFELAAHFLNIGYQSAFLQINNYKIKTHVALQITINHFPFALNKEEYGQYLFKQQEEIFELYKIHVSN